jgi:hypothetical protein
MKYLMIILLSFLIATGVSVAGVFILQTLNLAMTADTDMKNLPYGIAVGSNLFLALATLPVLLNLREGVRYNMVWSTLSFFLLPAVVMGYLAVSFEEEALTGVAFCTPYFIVLTVFFVKFRKQKEII